MQGSEISVPMQLFIYLLSHCCNQPDDHVWSKVVAARWSIYFIVLSVDLSVTLIVEVHKRDELSTQQFYLMYIYLYIYKASCRLPSILYNIILLHDTPRLVLSVVY